MIQPVPCGLGGPGGDAWQCPASSREMGGGIGMGASDSIPTATF